MEHYWKKQDGTKIRVNDMSTSHIKNTLRMMEAHFHKAFMESIFANNEDYPDDLLEDASNRKIMASKWIEIFQQELKNRGGGVVCPV